MKYIANYYYEYGDRILYDPKQVDSSYETTNNQVKIDEQVFSLLKKNITDVYCLLSINDIITLNDIENLTTIENDKVNVACFDTVGDKRFITGIARIAADAVDPNVNIPITRDAYFYLSQFDLTKDIFTFSQSVSNIRFRDLQRSSGLERARTALSSIGDVRPRIKYYTDLANTILSEKLDPLFILYFTNFIMLNNYFSSKGIFITPDNKDEQYLKLAQSNDSKVLKAFSRYLVLLEKVERYREKYDFYLEFLEELVVCSTVEQTERLWEAYSGSFLR